MTETAKPAETQKTPLFLVPVRQPSPQELAAGQNAMTSLMRRVTAAYEVKTGEPKNGVFTFYRCEKDDEDVDGLTIGYGTLFERRKVGEKYELTQYARDLLQQVKIYEDGKEVPENKKEEKLLEAFDEKKRGKFSITVDDAKKVYRYEYDLKKGRLDEILTTTGKDGKSVPPKKRSPIVEALATSYHFQGRLVGGVGQSKVVRQKRRDMFSKNELRRNEMQDRSLKSEGMRNISRRALADIHKVIEANPFEDNMTPDERAAHAEKLAKFSSAYAREMIACIHGKDNSIGYNQLSCKNFAVEVTKLAMLDIATRYYKRDLTPQEVAHIETQAKELVYSYSKEAMNAKTPVVRNETKILLDGYMAALKIPESVKKEYETYSYPTKRRDTEAKKESEKKSQKGKKESRKKPQASTKSRRRKYQPARKGKDKRGANATSSLTDRFRLIAQEVRTEREDFGGVHPGINHSKKYIG